jgi:hypothetical protein
MKTRNKYLKELIDIGVAFIVAWLLYQAISFAFGTSTPITSVVSESMKHGNNFDNWWNNNENMYREYGITKSDFEKYQFKNGLNIGDMMVVMSVQDSQIKQGDVIVYKKTDPSCFRNSITLGSNIIHRVVKIENGNVFTKGDNGYTNKNVDIAIDGSPCASKIEGKAVLALPLLGYPRLLLFMIGI